MTKLAPLLNAVIALIYPAATVVGGVVTGLLTVGRILAHTSPAALNAAMFVLHDVGGAVLAMAIQLHAHLLP